MKKTFSIKGMSCNSCKEKIEQRLKDKVSSVHVNLAKEKAEIDFNPEKTSEKEIREIIDNLGYESCLIDNKENYSKDDNKEKSINWGFFALIISAVVLIAVLYLVLKPSIPELKIPDIGEKTGLLLLFAAGLLTGFHCIAMCGGFLLSYTAKNAINGKKGFKQHLVYGGSKVISYSIMGGIFGLIGGFVAFSVGLRGWIAIIAGGFMIFYALGMTGIGFFKRFQLNPKFLTRFASKESGRFSGEYSRPLVTGLLNGLFIACGPLQAMYLYAIGTGSFFSGMTSLAAFGLGTLPVMLGFGFFATTISNKTTNKILKISAVIVLILGLIMLNRGLSLTGSSFSYDAIKANVIGGGTSATLSNGAQEVNMNVDASGYSPNSFVLKKGIPVKWNVNVKQLTGCNQELVMNEYGIDVKLKQGLNIINFTPEKTGTITFTCGMGMLRGNFIVTDSGEASQQQLSAATVKNGGGCSMGANGGSCGQATCGATTGGSCGCGGGK